MGEEESVLNNKNARLVIVSNRLPIAFEKEEDKFIVKRGSGGLVTALAPVLSDRGGNKISQITPNLPLRP